MTCKSTLTKTLINWWKSKLKLNTQTIYIPSNGPSLELWFSPSVMFSRLRVGHGVLRLCQPLLVFQRVSCNVDTVNIHYYWIVNIDVLPCGFDVTERQNHWIFCFLFIYLLNCSFNCSSLIYVTEKIDNFNYTFNF